MRRSKDNRIFFALWPNDPLRIRLNKVSQSFDIDESRGRRVPDYNLHLTLHFIGNVSFDDLACLQQQARNVIARSFELDIDCQGYFKKPRVLWLGCNQVSDALHCLHRNLGKQLRDCNFQPETRRYCPHITVARNIYEAPEMPSIESIRWSVRRFVMVESRSIPGGVQYRVIEEYPLI